MSKVFIHNNNLCGNFEKRILFSPNVELDKYISYDLLAEIEILNPNIIFIKDALSEQYIDLLGLRVAMHIRLSNSKLKLLPIVILSELTLFSLARLSPFAKILLTKNIFLLSNTKDDIDNFDISAIKHFNDNEYKNKFLDLIEIELQGDYLSHHGIANEWSIYRWAKALAVSSETIDKNKEKIEHTLYFKYLVAKEDINNVEKFKFKFNNGGKIVSIDDQLDNGWRDVLKSIFKYHKNIKFQPLNYDYQDKSNWAIMKRVLKFIEESDPDVVILDLRLSHEDYEQDIDIESVTGIRLLQEIHKINRGIQVIMLTATNKSIILEKLYKYKILGYVKKEHPDDSLLNTKENIEKFISLADKGFENSYLKKIYMIQEDLLSLELFQALKFDLNISNEEKRLWELKANLATVFDTLDSELSKKFIYSMFAIFKCIEIINDYYISTPNSEKKPKWRDTKKSIEAMAGNKQNNVDSVKNKMLNILKKLHISNRDMEDALEELVCSRNYAIHSGKSGRCEDVVIKNPTAAHVLKWFEFLSLIMKKIKKL